MSLIDTTLQEFGHSIGIESLSLDSAGAASLAFEQMGMLFFEKCGAGLLIYMVQELEQPGGELLERALEACHHRFNHPFVVNAGLRGDRDLLFSAFVQETELTLPQLEKVVQCLHQLHTHVRKGVPV